MKIGLIDVDCHGAEKKWGATVYPNLALAKLARYHKESGDEVEWALPFTHYDKIYMSKIFTFSPDFQMDFYQADEIVRGGTGYDIYSKLPDDVDRLQPDYSIYPSLPKDTAYGFLTRGCIRKCPWCVVPRKEGRIHPYMDIDEIAIEGRHKIVLMDNNLLAAGDYAKEQLQKIIDRGYRIDLNQASDCRLINEEWAEMFAKVKWIDRRIRFACDTPHEIEANEKAISLLEAKGFTGQFFLYCMLGGTKDFDESYNILHYWWKRETSIRHGEKRCHVYPYAQPYRDPDSSRHIIPQWQKDMAQWANKRQLFSTISFKEFSPRKGFKCEEYFY